MSEYPRTLKGTCGSGTIMYHYELTLESAEQADPLCKKEMDRVIQAQARGNKLGDFADGTVIKVNHKGDVYLTPLQIAAKMTPEQRQVTLDALNAVDKAEKDAKKAKKAA